MPIGVECAAAASTPGPDGEVIVAGGWGKGKRPLRSLLAYSPRAGKWRQLPKPPMASAAGGIGVVTAADGTPDVMLVGGTGEDGAGRTRATRAVETSVVITALH